MPNQARWRVKKSSLGGWFVSARYGGNIIGGSGKRFQSWDAAMTYANLQADRIRKCPQCGHQLHRSFQCRYPITEMHTDLYRFVGTEMHTDSYRFVGTPTGETRVVLVDVCGCPSQGDPSKRHL